MYIYSIKTQESLRNVIHRAVSRRGVGRGSQVGENRSSVKPPQAALHRPATDNRSLKLHNVLGPAGAVIIGGLILRMNKRQ